MTTITDSVYAGNVLDVVQTFAPDADAPALNITHITCAYILADGTVVDLTTVSATCSGIMATADPKVFAVSFLVPKATATQWMKIEWCSTVNPIITVVRKLVVLAVPNIP